MLKRKFSDEEEKEICKEYVSEEKPSTRTLGKKWDCDSLTIQNILRKNSYKIRPTAEYNKLFTEKQELQICKKYFSKEKPGCNFLSKKWDCTEPTIRNILKRNGYKLRTIGESRRLFTKNEEKKICNEYFSKEKIGTTTLAEKWGCSDRTIKQVFIRNGYKIRTKSEAHKGLKVWCDGLTKETNASLKKMSETLSKFSTKQEKQICKQYIEDRLSTIVLAKKWNCNSETISNIIKRNGYTLRTCNIFTKEQELEICKEYISNKNLSCDTLGKKWGCSLGTISNILKRNGYKSRSMCGTKSDPELILRALKNGHGKKCYYDNELFPSLAERDCYIGLKKLGFKIKHNFEGRFDFLINDKVVLEYHPCSYFLDKRTIEQYYKDRRKLLTAYGYKDLKLIVVEDIKEIENKLGNLI